MTTKSIDEHKKGVKAIKYSKKPQPLVGPEAQKKKSKAPPPKTELQKHSKLSATLEGVAEGMDYSKRTKLIHYLAKKLDIEINYLELASDDELVDLYKKSKSDMSESRPKGYDSEGNPQGGGWDEYDNSKKSWTVVVDGKSWKTFDDERQAYKAADAIRQKYGKKTRVISEGKIKINIKHPPETAQEKLYKKHQELRKKSGLPDPEEYKKQAAQKQKEIDDMKEAKQPEAPRPRNFVAKNAKTAGAGAHKDAKKAAKEVRGQKHKNKEMAETYDQARAARIRYFLMLREGDWDQQSDEMTPPEYDMSPEELKAIRNAEFTEQDKIQAMIKLAAGGTSDEDIAKIYDMDKETVAGILDDYVEEIEAETSPEDDVKEAEMGKVIDYKPGQTATIDTGPGMTTILDLKKNPTSLTKDPATGKLQLLSTPKTTAQPSATTQSTVKPGDAVEIGKTTEDLLRLAGLK